MKGAKQTATIGVRRLERREIGIWEDQEQEPAEADIAQAVRRVLLAEEDIAQVQAGADIRCGRAHTRQARVRVRQGLDSIGGQLRIVRAQVHIQSRLAAVMEVIRTRSHLAAVMEVI